MEPTIKELKKESRKIFVSKRDSLSDEEIASWSEKIENRLFEFERFTKASTIMIFVSFRSEVRTEGMIRRALSEGKRVIIPIVNENNLIPSELKDFDADLAPGNFGILEPKKDCVRPVKPVEIDFLISPGMGFDRAGNRMGFGRGFYDRFIESLKPGTIICAIAFSAQVVESVPAEAHDKNMDFIITENEIINCWEYE